MRIFFERRLEHLPGLEDHALLQVGPPQIMIEFVLVGLQADGLLKQGDGGGDLSPLRQVDGQVI